MNLETAPLVVALFFITAIVLAGFAAYVQKAGKIQRAYTGLVGALLGVIFAILIVMFTGNLMMATAVGIIIFGWFLAMSRLGKGRNIP